MPPQEPGYYPLKIRRGTTEPPFVVEIPIDGTGSEWRLTIALPNGDALVLTTEDGSLTAANVTVEGGTWTRVTWPRTLEQSRMIPIGQLASYEIEQVEPSGGQGLWLEGSVEGVGGINND